MASRRPLPPARQTKRHISSRADSVTASGEGCSPSDPSSNAQSQTRRAQVRSAQIRHRQRKANYQKQLELDAGKYRDLVSQAGAEAKALREENEAIRAALSKAGIDVSWLVPKESPSTEEQAQAGLQSMQIDPYTSPSVGAESQTPPSATTPELFSNIDVNDLTITLTMDDTMGSPSFNISSSSSGASLYSGTSPPQSDDGWSLSPAQEQAAINFILAYATLLCHPFKQPAADTLYSLEHVCWDHFCLGDFHHHTHKYYPDLPEGMDENDHGHALMASTLCMAHAPTSLYDDRAALGSTITHLPATAQLSPDATFQWQSPGITLASLRGLASSLNPGDQELTPVQAWFELAERYPPVTLLEGGVLEQLKKEFRGVVRCVSYGAMIEREAFESVVRRVIREFTPGA